MRMIKRALVVLTAVFALGFSEKSVTAQEDFDKMFEEMMQEFFPKDLIDEIESIREKDKKAKSGSFFRNDPRFLEIKERQIRTRTKDQVEKQHPENLKTFQPLAKSISPSVVSIYQTGNSDDRLAFATAVSKKGLLITKASELNGQREVTCIDNNNKKFTAKVIKFDETHDLAMLKADKTLEPVKFESLPMDEGTLLVTVGNSKQPVSLGTLAVKPRSIIGKNRGFLGVEPAPDSKGVLIKSVNTRSAAERAGILPGDVVTSINNVPTNSVAELVREIGSKKKGDSIRLVVIRGSRTQSITAALDGRMLSGERAARFEMMRRLGTVLSQRRDEFPSVMEHDSPILPDECGSPVIDLDGKVIGINIARAGRTSTYALPMTIVKKFVDSYKL